MSETGTTQDAAVRPRVGVSSCLLGEPVRFNGGHSRCRFLTEQLDPYVEWVPYCPEMEIGLPWLAGQTYLEPFPAALRLRHTVPR